MEHVRNEQVIYLGGGGLLFFPGTVITGHSEIEKKILSGELPTSTENSTIVEHTR